MQVDNTMLEDLIDQLIASNQACLECLRSSAQAVADLGLRTELQSYASTHETLTLELASIATKLELSACQRQLKAIAPAMPGRSTFQYALVTKDRYTILAECQQRLCLTLECYEEILKAQLPAWVIDALTLQSQKIQQAYHNIYRMCIQAQPQFTKRLIKHVPVARRVEPRLSPWPAQSPTKPDAKPTAKSPAKP